MGAIVLRCYCGVKWDTIITATEGLTEADSMCPTCEERDRNHKGFQNPKGLDMASVRKSTVKLAAKANTSDTSSLEYKLEMDSHNGSSKPRSKKKNGHAHA